MATCPQCGSTETRATPRGGCFGTFLFFAFMIGIPVVIGIIVPNFWNWMFGPGPGDFTFFTQGFFWHFLIVIILSGVLAGLLAFKVFKIQRRDPGTMLITCSRCGASL
jgi:hypothetical protein